MDISRDEFYRVFDALKSDLKDDLVAIRDHLATQNGRIGKGEVERENLRTRMVSVEKEVFNRRRDDGMPAPETARTLVTKQNLYIVVGMGTIWVAMRVLEHVGTKVVEVVWAMVTKVNG